MECACNIIPKKYADWVSCGFFLMTALLSEPVVVLMFIIYDLVIYDLVEIGTAEKFIVVCCMGNGGIFYLNKPSIKRVLAV